MAVIFNIKCKSKDEMTELRDKILFGIKTSMAYETSEIAICPLQDDAFTLIVGANNVNDIELDVNSFLWRPYFISYYQEKRNNMEHLPYGLLER